MKIIGYNFLNLFDKSRWIKIIGNMSLYVSMCLWRSKRDSVWCSNHSENCIYNPKFVWCKENPKKYLSVCTLYSLLNYIRRYWNTLSEFRRLFTIRFFRDFTRLRGDFCVWKRLYCQYSAWEGAQNAPSIFPIRTLRPKRPARSVILTHVLYVQYKKSFW